jgi:hypothetical protein
MKLLYTDDAVLRKPHIPASGTKLSETSFTGAGGGPGGESPIVDSISNNLSLH